MKQFDQPDPKFVGDLERNLFAAVRRSESLYSERRLSMRLIKRTWPVIVSVAVVAMGAGSAATIAVTQRAHSRTSELLVARANALRDFADARFDLMNQGLTEMTQLVENGVANDTDLIAMTTEVRQAESESVSRRLDLEEVQISGDEPENALWAPRIDGRDFVTERLLVDRRVLGVRVEAIGQMIERISARPNTVDASETVGLEFELRNTDSDIRLIDERLALRQSFLAGDVTAEEIEILLNLRESETQKRKAVLQMEMAVRELDRIRVLKENNFVTSAELQEAELALRSAQLVLRLADLRMKLLVVNPNESSVDSIP
jgi:hypothetical protein